MDAPHEYSNRASPRNTLGPAEKHVLKSTRSALMKLEVTSPSSVVHRRISMVRVTLGRTMGDDTGS